MIILLRQYINKGNCPCTGKGGYRYFWDIKVIVMITQCGREELTEHEC